MKALLVIAMLIALTATQTTVTPKTQACVCTNLLNSADCLALTGCAWTAANTTNSTNTTATASGTCANATTTTTNVTTTPTFCGSVANASTACAGTLGCAYLNSTCQIFTGCSAYVQTTNAACQAISTQCTTDGTRCVSPGACSTYTTQALCTGNIATSGARQCKWTAGTGTTGTCGDMICTDAPTTYSTLAQCQGWISTCLSTGKGCVTSLGLCSSYTIAAGCTGMIGSDGACTANTAAGSTACRPLACTDAPTTTATNTACNTFLSGCVTTGKGCVSVLSACSSYAQTLGCSGLVGSDGACTTDTTAGAANCRAQLCTDAPASTSTDAACNTFKTGCQTTGSGCVTSRGACSSYQGTTTTCTSFIGTDGNCKGTGTTVGACAARLCTDAPTTSNTNAACATFQTGCVTTGAGCVASLGACSTYQGTATTCTQYRGSDGNCTAPASQTSAAACVAKVCTDGVFTTNSACQAFSYLCVTDGTKCVQPGSCETIGTALTCQGQSTCNSGTQCLNRTTCVNYLTQSQCLLNQQQYVPSGTTTTYLRSCTWTTTCVNKLCTEQAASLTTDAACAGALAGCVTTGAGCVDISAQCTAYQGTGTTCANFKGLNGTKVCTALATQTVAASCIDRTCGNATTANGATTTYASTSACQAYLSTCYWNGNTGCTNGGCDSYFGLQSTCSAITTAGVPCWSLSTTGVNGECIVKACTHAPSTLTTDAQCAGFLTGCVTNGAGCVVGAVSDCTVFKGNLAQCTTFNESTNRQCSKVANLCGERECTDNVANPNQTTCVAYLSTCFFNGIRCAVKPTPAACSSYKYTSAAQCNSLVNTTNAACGFISGASACSDKACGDVIANPSQANCVAYLSTCYFDGTNCVAAPTSGACNTYTASSATACNNLKNTASAACGYIASATKCSDRTCGDVIANPSQENCVEYLSTCYFDGTNCVAAPTSGACNTYTASSATACNNLKDTASAACGYIASATKCSDKSCADVIANPSQGKCVAYLSTCYFDGTGCTAKPSSASSCNTYTSSSELGCNSLLDSASKACGYIASATKCSDKTCGDVIYSPNQQNCVQYLSTCYFDGTNCVTAPTSGACNTYTASSATACNNLKNTASAACGYIASATKCSDRTCGDVIANPSQSVCSTYLSTCYFNGTSCASKPTAGACSSYALTSATACNNVQNNATIPVYCGFVAGATNCSDRACTDVIANPSLGNCSAYLSTCSFNGTSCYTKGACDSYVATGATNAAKATFCNLLNNTTNAKCTYISGNNCADTQTNCTGYSLTNLDQCSLVQNAAGALCGFTAGGNSCSDRTCAQQLSETACSDSWLTGCVVKTTTSCATKACNLAAATNTTNAACAAYRQGCVTNGAGCVESSALCTAYQGTQATCQTFTGGVDGLCNNVAGATATTACIARTCAANTTATTNAACTTWKPNCVWTGSTGCKDPSTCSGFNGTIDSCPTFTATDGPCSGTGSTAAACVSNSTICNQAPATYSTHTQCQTWHTSCQTNGFGCINAGAACNLIVSPTACPLYKTLYGCDVANECLTKPSTCGGFTTAFQCNNVPLSGQTTVTCAWSTVSGTCVNLTCNLLPVTLTTDSACSAALATCTTNGAGCVTRGACSTYNKQACGPAATTDTQKLCIWSNSVCRPIICSDNTTATSDAACNTYLTGCRTTGLGCSNSLTCSSFTSAAFCLKDQSNNPCLWYRGACINYTKCTDVVATTHANCQLVSPLCTTNGITCVAITGCSATTLQASCILGTDGNCGWLPAAGTAAAQCALYTSCTVAQGTTTAQCLLWGSTCVSNGTSCIAKTTCSSYTTQVGCANAGTDGTCFYVAPIGTATTGTCRLQLCTDATATTASSITTHTGCVGFTATTACTTSGTGCISQSACGSYTAQAGCVQGTDGVCFWATTTTAATATIPASSTSVCRLKQCSDLLLTSSASCLTAITGVKCVSNGVNCIAQATCSSYTAKEACLGGGSDGACAFTPGTNTTTPNVGTCALFTSCTSANSDSVACGSRSDACFFNSTTTNGTTTTSCSSHTCATKAQGSTCQAIPSFDLSTYSICVLTGTTCAAGNPTSFTQSQCYGNSVKTYTWNPTTSACQSCQTQTNTNSTNNNTNNTNNTSGYLISILIAMTLMF